MSQGRSFQWKDDDLTKLLNLRLVGILQPGVYRGFNGRLVDGLTLYLEHEETALPTGDNGFRESSYDETPIQFIKLGALLTKQGVVVKETEPIELPITANATGNPRRDLIVCRSKYIEVPGGEPAEYVVYTGTPGATPALPALSFPPQELIIGELWVPAGTASLTDEGVRFIRTKAPDFGNQTTIMHTDREQVSTERKTFEEIGMTHATIEIPSGSPSVLIVDTQEAVTGVWTESNATHLTLDFTDNTVETYIRFSAIACRLSQGRVLTIRVVGIASTLKVMLNASNFLSGTPQLNAPWDSVAGPRNDLQLHNNDVVVLSGANTSGTLWHVLAIQSGKALRNDRRVTLENSVVFKRGNDTNTPASNTVYFDWTTNVVEPRVTNSFVLHKLIPSDGLVQEPNLPDGYVIYLVPRYTGSGTQTEENFAVQSRELAGVDGNIVLPNKADVLLPWGKVAIFIARDNRWHLVNHSHGVMVNDGGYLTTSGNVDRVDGTGAVAIVPSGSNFHFSTNGVRVTVSIDVIVDCQGTGMTAFRWKAPYTATVWQTGARRIAGHGYVYPATGDPYPVVWHYANEGNYLTVKKVDGSAFTGSQELRFEARLEFEAFNSY